ncbi:MAG: c-type cytochrome [Acidimicrobiia bacterium]|jgi:hypothetical protein
MSEFLSGAAERLGVPESITRRSAEARAKATGATVDEILQAWAGGEGLPASAAPPPEPAPASAPAAAVAVAGPDAEAEPEPEPEPAPAAEPTAAPASAPPPAPTTVTLEEAARHPVVVSVPTSGLTERIGSFVPTWLTTVFLVIPAVGLLYIAGGGAAAECHDGGLGLEVDRITGEAVNCDGSPFEGRGDAGGGADFIALGQRIFVGQEVAAANCAGCHGANGGGGVGPALGGVTLTFSACTDNIEWVGLGTAGFQAAGRTAYGDLNKPVGGGGNMPGFQATLSPEQIASVVAYTRVRFGGADDTAELEGCGLVEGAGDGDEEGTEPGEETGEPADADAAAPLG